MPLGFKIILAFETITSIEQIVYFIKGVYIKTFLGLSIPHNVGIIHSLIILLISILIIISIIKRYSWGWKLILGYNFLDALILSINLPYTVSTFPNPLAGKVLTGIYFIFLIILLIYSLYVYRKRDYFNK